MQEYTSQSPAETEKIAAALAQKLRPGDFLALEGEMGAGKTAFVRGLARGLGIKTPVSSPTFAIVNEYRGNPGLLHFDLYRIGDPEELFAIGFDDYLERGEIMAVEWSENLGEERPENVITVRIVITGEQTRTITVCGEGRF